MTADMNHQSSEFSSPDYQNVEVLRTFLEFRDKSQETEVRRRAYSLVNVPSMKGSTRGSTASTASTMSIGTTIPEMSASYQGEQGRMSMQSTESFEQTALRAPRKDRKIRNSVCSTSSSLMEIPEGKQVQQDHPQQQRCSVDSNMSAASEENSILMEFQRPVNAHPREMTLMIRNVPNRYTQRMFLAEIRKYGFDRTFDFIYMPMDFRTKNNMGYCFLNFIDFNYARQFVDEFEGQKLAAFKSQKTLAIQPANTQGLFGNMKSFQSNEKEVPAEYQPIIFDAFSGLEILREKRVPSRVDSPEFYENRYPKRSMNITVSTECGESVSSGEMYAQPMPQQQYYHPQQQQQMPYVGTNQQQYCVPPPPCQPMIQPN